MRTNDLRLVFFHVYDITMVLTTCSAHIITDNHRMRLHISLSVMSVLLYTG